MKSLWCDEQAKQYPTPLEQRVYTSRLLGQEPALVLHGGGNTSVKDTVNDFFGQPQELLYVKGSGWDLATIEAPGFAPVKMDTLMKMAALDDLSDEDMVKYQRAAMTDPSAPNPSVEAILHAIIPFKFVDHTHTDAVVTLTNSPNGEQHMADLYGKRIFIIPYVMPGFALAKLVYQMTKDINWNDYDGMVLMNHGLFTFADDAKTAYEKTIELVTEAEEYIANKKAVIELPQGKAEKLSEQELFELATIRQKVSQIRGMATIAKLNRSPIARKFASEDINAIATRGPLTPDHVIRTKRIAAIINQSDDTLGEIDTAMNKFVDDYHQYFKDLQGGETCLNPSPNYAIWQNIGAIAFGKNIKETQVIEDINNHTFSSILTAEKIDNYQALPAKDIFDVEYWSLEQAKLKKTSSVPALAGQIVLVTNACHEASQAMIKTLLSQGASVVATDTNSNVSNLYKQANCIGITVSDENPTKGIFVAVKHFGGLDIIVNSDNADALITRAEEFQTIGINASIIAINGLSGTKGATGTSTIRQNQIQVNEANNDEIANMVATMAGATFYNVCNSQVTLG